MLSCGIISSVTIAQTTTIKHLVKKKTIKHFVKEKRKKTTINIKSKYKVKLHTAYT